LIAGIEKLIKEFGKYTLDDIDVVGIAWPGAVRRGTIAATSGIFKYFVESVLSNYIRKNSVDDILEINVEKKLKEELDKITTGDIFVSMLNDIASDGMGRIILNRFSCDHGLIIKSGTGAGACYFSKERGITDDIFEIGKVLLNLNPNKISLDKDQLPRGLLNNYFSTKLLTSILIEITKEEFSSFEIAEISEYILDKKESLKALILKLGNEIIYNREWESEMSHSEFIKTEIGDELDKVKYKTGLERICKFALSLFKVGEYKEKNITVRIDDYPIKSCNINEINTNILIETGIAEDLIKEIFNENESEKIIEEIFGKAGSVIADALIVLRRTLKQRVDFFIFCGGVFDNSKFTRRKILESAKKHLLKKYDIYLKGYSSYQEDITSNLLQKNKNIVYHNFTKEYDHIDFSINENLNVFKKMKDYNYGLVGSIYNAKFWKYRNSYTPEYVVTSENGENIKFMKKNEICNSENFLNVEVTAIIVKEERKVVLLKRHGGRYDEKYLFQSGKVEKIDLYNIVNRSYNEPIEMYNKNSVIRELKEELDIQLKSENVIYLGTMTSDKIEGINYRFYYLLNIVEINNTQYDSIKIDSSIYEIKKFNIQDLENKCAECGEDKVFLEMKKLLIERY
jgi:hypothetical protein